MNEKSLTPRQIEVVRLIASGLQNKQIAYEMHVSEATVKLHISGLLSRLGVKNRTGAVMKALRMNLL